MLVASVCHLRNLGRADGFRPEAGQRGHSRRVALPSTPGTGNLICGSLKNFYVNLIGADDPDRDESGIRCWYYGPMSLIIGMGRFIMGKANRVTTIIRTDTESAKTENYIGFGGVGEDQKEISNR